MAFCRAFPCGNAGKGSGESGDGSTAYFTCKIHGEESMSDYNEYKKKVLTDPVIKSEYEALNSKYESIQKTLDSKSS